MLDGDRRAFVELHLDVGAEEALDFNGAFRRQHVARAVDMRLERHAVFGEFPQLRQRHHLKAARVGKDRMRPVHESVQSAECGDALRRRPQHQMIGVAEHDVGACRPHMLGQHRLHRAGGADRHEGGRPDCAMRGLDDAGARRAVYGMNSK